MKRAITALVGLGVWVSFGADTMASTEGSATSGNGVQQRLMDGNTRYAGACLSHPNQTEQRRTELAQGQHPFAAIVSCADSRVPPEILFDQGLGDLFVIRLAGNIMDDAALASLEYAVDHLGVRYIMILGHERCGAVEATIQGGETPGHIGSLIKAIQPAVDNAKNQPGDPLDNAVRANVAMVVQQVKSSPPILEELAKKGDLTVLGARYDLDDGRVTILP
ncbi:MAG: carbonic anhydrase [Lentisphaerae bacterium RIFOXYB12_FULL_65_16]|nr:MAG: carbonic anhydrase [Lentisphaerae bacterium RIFOXYA12_64_32]OGV87044.1 MAG: carbonic anhydrase [Lentisphaerae bacterium RIFOXYB12_FULL_65_16]